MFVVISVLIFIVCILLILIVLVQNSKGGGLAANFSASNQVMGVRKTTDFLEKATWVLAGSLLFLSILAAAFIPRETGESNQSLMQEQIDAAQDPSQMQKNFPLNAPPAEEPAKK
ncbi:MAG TPA: preprotein translocase subunit SecG [Marinilabiliales bacterium]|jgi:preprotein translocase subunit SecG|nr:preprotein translocase subunit SecG [Salinivirgaceae bacterium]OFX49292.1 MAG: preprotein translocase subunit SecG [Bacteroidetes bacterium GWA2_40_14]OFX57623.1 MAG: preprotein translocase subunit SecG [Bacteroidetes bacterium GWC2_40_13]OFX73519.1 MAG: preprotein translocase subunit SecG [Bacteroidetes bacterium GWD2_40_43]OFX90805.1 MAG: preprotein translocase subunit SecG [Bacteroidetes bacterium GWE2_40_63]OFY20563.1 MAG: preprotein translocase subunit SecG [Bacteroidetes bacterium GWF